MISGILKNLKYLLTGDAAREEEPVVEEPNLNIVNSSVSNPELLDSTAMVENSTLWGVVEIGPYSSIVNVSLLGGEIKIGRNVSINGPNTDINCKKNSVSIGNFVSIARNVSIQEYNHFMDRCTTYFINEHLFDQDWKEHDIDSAGPITIGNDVWIGAHSVVLSGVTIGDGAVVGANSVVNRDIPPYAIVAGCPAKFIRYRFESEIIDKLLEIQWWNWSRERIIENKELFQGKLTLEKLLNIK